MIKLFFMLQLLFKEEQQTIFLLRHKLISSFPIKRSSPQKRTFFIKNV